MRYDTPDIAQRYTLGRRMSPQMMQVWLNAISAHFQHRPVCVLDIGCGTGRFTSALAERFETAAIGLDPSLAMLNEALQHTQHPRVWFACAVAERLPIDAGKIDLAFLSMVFHHLSDLQSAGRELKRVTRNGGYLCVRNSTLELLDRMPHLTFFPGARGYNQARLPSQSTVVATFERAGFRLLSHEAILQELASSFGEFREKISKHALSELMLMPDAEFASGLAAMDHAIARGAPPGPIIEPIDLFMFAA